MKRVKTELAELGVALVVLDGRLVAAFVRSVGEHDEVGLSPLEVLAVDRVVPEQLVPRARAVDAERIHDRAGSIPLHRDAEQPNRAPA